MDWTEHVVVYLVPSSWFCAKSFSVLSEIFSHRPITGAIHWYQDAIFSISKFWCINWSFRDVLVLGFWPTCVSLVGLVYFVFLCSSLIAFCRRRRRRAICDMQFQWCWVGDGCISMWFLCDGFYSWDGHIRLPFCPCTVHSPSSLARLD